MVELDESTGVMKNENLDKKALVGVDTADDQG
jgi:hypothetical protein